MLTNKYEHLQQKNSFFILLLLFICLLTSCSSNRHLRDLQKYVDDLTKSTLGAPEKVTPLPLHIPTPVIYQANSDRSPFDASGEITKTAHLSILHPLQNYTISSLKFKGLVITQDKQSYAFILAPDEKLYQVKLGDIIGNHYGKISKIYPDRIEVEEQVTDNSKLATTRIVTLQLKD